MGRPAVNDQKNLVFGADHEPPEKFDENRGVNAALFLGHEPHVAARRDGGDQAHPVTRSRARHDGGLPEAAIEVWLDQRNAKPKPFKWTAQANTILDKNARGRRALEEAVSRVSNE